MSMILTHHAINLTEACDANGSGDCDGYFYEEETRYFNASEPSVCSCSCHRVEDLPETVEGVKAWHDEFHGVTA